MKPFAASDIPMGGVNAQASCFRWNAPCRELAVALVAYVALFAYRAS